VAERRIVDGGRLFGAGEAALEALGWRLWPANRFDYERWLARARSSRVSAEFDRARAEGRALSLEDAAAWILEGRAPGAVTLPPPPPGMGLTPRERDVAALAARGMSNRQIAQALSIAEKTAANHVQRALEKLDVRTRTQLAARAGEFGLLWGEKDFI
jgi:DNA-binding NarL/FixJ family response regulator